MPTSSNVTIFVDLTESPRIMHYPARPLSERLPSIIVPESITVSFDAGTAAISANGTPAEVSGWFRAMADLIDATATAELVAAQHEPIPFTVTDAGVVA